MSTLANQPIQAARGADAIEAQGSYAPPAFEEPSIGFGDVVRVLKQRKVTIIVATIIAYILVCGATFAIATFAPLWESEALFELSPPVKSDLMGTVENVDTNTMERMLQTEAGKLRGLSLLLNVARDDAIRSTQYYRWYGSDAMKCAMGLKRDLIAQPIPDTRLIRVSLGCRNKTEARTIVQTIADEYFKTFQTESTEDAGKRYNTLKNTLASIDSEMQEKRNQLRAQREKASVAMSDRREVTNAEYIAKMMESLSQIGAEVASLEAQLNSLSGIDPNQLPLTAEHRLLIESDPMLRYYRSQVEAMDIEIQAVALLLGENHRQTQILRERRMGYYSKEIAKREELMSEVRMRQVESLRDDLSRRRAQQSRLQESVQTAEAEARDADRSLLAIRQIEDDIEGKKRLIETVENEVKAAELASRDQSRARLKRVQDAQEAVEPSRPYLPLYLGAGAALAILAGVGVAFLREFTDQAIRTPVDVARFGHLSVLGAIPELDDEEAELDEIELAVRQAPQSLIAEQFRKVRTNLMFSARADEQRILLITSPSPGDGKTAVAINLAVTFAHSNQRVLLIDCNFRRPMIRERFTGTRPEGLSNVLTGQAEFEKVITQTDLPNLSVLTSGQMPPRPAELLGSQAMRDLLNAAVKQFDRVILDGPPALLISDAVVLAMQVDGVVLVTRAQANTKGLLKRARESLEGINARIFGAILNGVKARAGGYFKQQYREFYDYTSDETIPPGVAELPPADRDGRG